MADTLREEPLPPGNAPERIGRYVVQTELGRGGMGAVYRAWDPRLDRAVAIKFLLDPRDAQATPRFVREATATAKLRHPGIVSVLDTGTHDGKPFIVMELIEGESLETLL